MAYDRLAPCRVDLFRQKSTCRGLQPLPDVATRRQTRENKGHVNYDLSDRGKGGEVFLALGTASCLVEDTTCQRDENVIVVPSFLVAWGSTFNLWERQTPSFCNVVAHASDTSPKPRAQLSILSKDITQGSILTKMVFDKMGKGGGGGQCFGLQVSSIWKL